MYLCECPDRKAESQMVFGFSFCPISRQGLGFLTSCTGLLVFRLSRFAGVLNPSWISGSEDLKPY